MSSITEWTLCHATRATRRLQADLASDDDDLLLGDNNGLLLYLAIRRKDEAQGEQGGGNARKDLNLFIRWPSGCVNRGVTGYQ